MANKVFANGREVSCSSGAGKVICAFPDVVFTPPLTPATPPGVPIPYPVTSMSSDTDDGSKGVKINKKEVMLRNKSNFKKCTGDEAGSAPKKGLINSSQGKKTYFKSWSMDVKIEGENVVRHLDITTSNHLSELANASLPMPELENMVVPAFDDCEKYKEHEKEKCADSEQAYAVKTAKKTGKKRKEKAGRICTEECKEAKACILAPKKDDKSFCCQPSTTGHHLVEVHGFTVKGDRKTPLPEFPNYKEEEALCVCAQGTPTTGEHGDLHAIQGVKETFAFHNAPNRNPPRDPKKAWTYGEARQAGVEAHQETFKDNKLKCNPKCIGEQLDQYHNQHLPEGDDTPLRTKKVYDDISKPTPTKGIQMIKDRANRIIGSISSSPVKA